MIHPEKWRETANSYDLEIKNFKIESILGYPHAGNDVFQVDAIFEEKPCRAFIKMERQNGADIAWSVAPCLTALPPGGPFGDIFFEKKKQKTFNFKLI